MSKEVTMVFNLLKKKCYLCNKKLSVNRARKYLNDNNKKIYVCYHCVEYAERRAFRVY